MPVIHKMVRRLIDTDRKDEARKIIDRVSFFAPDDEKIATMAEELD
jgi:hypothetical protein